jgi:hypothetical protein
MALPWGFEEQQAMEQAEDFMLPYPAAVQEKLSGHDVFLKFVPLTLFQMRTGVGIPMTSQLKYTLAPVTFQMSLGGVTMEGPTRETQSYLLAALSISCHSRT